MKKFRYRKLVFCNIRKNRRLIRKLRICLTAAAFLVISFVGTLLCLSSSYRSLEKILMRFRNVYCNVRELGDADAITAEILGNNGVAEVEISAFAFMAPRGTEYDIFELPDINAGQCFLVCDGVEFQGVSASTRLVPMWMKALVFPDISPFSGALTDALQREYPAEMISCGSMISGEGQVVMSQRVLRQFGFGDDEQKKLVGKRISVGIDIGGERRICLNDLLLTGIISEEFAAENFPVFSHIWFSYNGENQDVLYQAELGGQTDEKFCVTMFTDTFKDCRRLRADLLRAGFNSCGYDSSVDTAVMLDDIVTLAAKAFSLLVIFFAVILLVSFVGSFSFYSENSAQNYRMLALLGVRRDDISGIVKREILAVFAPSFLLCTFLSAAYFAALPIVLKHLMNAQLQVMISPANGALTFILGSLIFVAGSVAAVNFMKKRLDQKMFFAIEFRNF